MRKVIVIGRRAPGRSRVTAQTHMRTVHAARVVFVPPDAGSMPPDDAQNHVFDGVYPSIGP